MASNFHGLRTAIYFVADMPAARQWYTDVLGMLPYFDEPFYVGFNVGGYELGLHPGATKSAPAPQSVTVYWGVDDVEATFTSLLAAGATAFEAPENVGGEIVVAAVHDPWGNIFGIIKNPHFKLP